MFLLAAASPAQSAHEIVGTYHCVTRETGHPTWHFTSTNTAWGAWMRADATFPPQNGAPADKASTFVGFDRTAKRWSIVSLDLDGSYYTRHSTSPTFDGSRWTDNFPADGGTAIIRVSNSRDYTFDFTGRSGPRSDVSHTTCTRQNT